MIDISSIIQSGTGNAWLLLPTAVMLGALHALEPGHSKSMMTAFIVAIHGTVRQAALLAISATVGHTIVVWALALAAWRLGDAGFLERAEPWLLLIGGLLLVVLALRILLRLNSQARRGHRQSHDQDHVHPHSHDHHGYTHRHADADDDTHAAAHAAEIKNRFTGGPVTDGEVMWFGFSGGLLPCPAAFAVLLACLHQKAYALGVVMVAAFSIGLALMLVAIGAAAAWGADALRSRFGVIERLSQWAPYLSAMIVLAIGIMGIVAGARVLV